MGQKSKSTVMPKQVLVPDLHKHVRCSTLSSVNGG